MFVTPTRSIFLCATPRSGSTLLCSLLNSSGVAGHFQSWFRRQDRSDYADDWNVVDRGFRAYLNASIRSGQGKGKTFACRLMAESHGELLADLRAEFGQAPDRDLLKQAFGQIDFVFLERRDKVAQAVSRLLAETSGLWHRSADGSVLEANDTWLEATPEYDFDAIRAFHAEAEIETRYWQSWFQSQGISPITVLYEDLASRAVPEATRVLSELNLKPASPLSAGTAKLADTRNRSWIAKYTADRNTEH